MSGEKSLHLGWPPQLLARSHPAPDLGDARGQLEACVFIPFCSISPWNAFPPLLKCSDPARAVKRCSEREWKEVEEPTVCGIPTEFSPRFEILHFFPLFQGWHAVGVKSTGRGHWTRGTSPDFDMWLLCNLAGRSPSLSLIFWSVIWGTLLLSSGCHQG